MEVFSARNVVETMTASFQQWSDSEAWNERSGIEQTVMWDLIVFDKVVWLSNVVMLQLF